MRLLRHPLVRDVDLDDPRSTLLQKRIIAEKKFLRKLYLEWYAILLSSLPPGDGAILELGSGAGFFGDVLPEALTSDIVPAPHLTLAADAHRLPFAEASLRAIVMTNVLHHFARPRGFLAEAARCVRPGGRVAMIEPWVTSWSRFVYGRLHHEPFDPRSPGWEGPGGGPLTGANGALPWIIFERDRDLFEREFPQWRRATVKPFLPLRYLLSGGVSLRSLTPSWTFSWWKGLESLGTPWMGKLAMFAEIVLVRRESELTSESKFM
jgi:SAM-dependent methyltransferase